jgi:hypothetical protein
MKSAIFATLLFGFSSLANSEPENEEITVACLKANPVMYFVPASKKLSSKLLMEMKSSISSGSFNCKANENNSELCAESEFSVFHGRDGKGKQADFALICQGSAGESNFNYYSSEYLKQISSCINASWYENKFEFN